MQSVWYRQDYDMIKDCLEDKYWVSDFDKNCPSIEEESDQVCNSFDRLNVSLLKSENIGFFSKFCWVVMA